MPEGLGSSGLTIGIDVSFDTGGSTCSSALAVKHGGTNGNSLTHKITMDFPIRASYYCVCVTVHGLPFGRLMGAKIGLTSRIGLTCG